MQRRNFLRSIVGLVLASLTGLRSERAQAGDGLRFEESRGGDLFPHLYGALPMRCVLWVKPMPLGADNRHQLPDLG